MTQVYDFESFLKANAEAGAVDFRLRADVDDEGIVTFYVQPLDHDGLTLDMRVAGNMLVLKD